MSTVTISTFEAVRRAQAAEARMQTQRDLLVQVVADLLDNIHDTERDDGIVQAVERARAALEEVRKEML